MKPGTVAIISAAETDLGVLPELSEFSLSIASLVSLIDEVFISNGTNHCENPRS
jgi:hypothetical protein